MHQERGHEKGDQQLGGEPDPVGHGVCDNPAVVHAVRPRFEIRNLGKKKITKTRKNESAKISFRGFVFSWFRDPL